MVRSILSRSVLVMGIFGGASAMAQNSSAPVTAATPSDFTFSANLSLASQYRFRGIMQTNDKPAVQGGFDLAHTSGLYIGNWNSSISWLDDMDPDVSSAIEMDFYAGYTRKIWGDVSFDVGVMQYYYPGSYPSGFTDPDTTELYLGVGYGPVTFKYSHALTNLFGTPDSKNSQYYELGGSVPVGVWGLSVDAHVGHQHVRNVDDASYTDWSLGVSKTFSNGIGVSLAYVDTNADRNFYSNTKGKYTGRSAAILSVSAAF